MKHKQRLPKFNLLQIGRFDARQGYKRCDPPGIGVSAGGRRENPTADFWWNPNGDIVGRLSCAGERFWFQGTRAAGGQVKENDMEAFQDYMVEVLVQWMAGGIHEMDGISDWVPWTETRPQGVR